MDRSISSDLIHIYGIRNSIQYPIVSHNKEVEMIFARNGMALCSRKFRM